VVLADL